MLCSVIGFFYLCFNFFVMGSDQCVWRFAFVLNGVQIFSVGRVFVLLW